jgi:hypothetical protein
LCRKNRDILSVYAVEPDKSGANDIEEWKTVEGTKQKTAILSHYLKKDTVWIKWRGEYREGGS